MAYDLSYLMDFTGGENTVSAPDQLLENQVLRAWNADLPLRGGFVKRKGSTAHVTGFPAPVARLIEFEYLSGTTRMRKTLALCTNGNMYLASAPTVVAYAWGNGYHVDYEVYKNKCYLIGNGKFVVWDGATFADVAYTGGGTDSNLDEVKKCNLLEQRGERLFAAGHPTLPNALFFCEPADPTYWKTTAVINAISDDGDVITGIKEFFDAIVVFKTRSIYAWTGWDPTTDVEFNRLAAAMGTRAYRTIQYVGSKLVYLGDDGLYALSGTFKNVIVTERLTTYHTPEFAAIYRPKDDIIAMNPNHAVVHDGKYLLSCVVGSAWVLSGGGLQPHTDVYVLSVDALEAGTVQISTYKGWSVLSWVTASATESGVTLLYGATGTAIHQYQVGYNDNGAAYTVTVRTAPQAQGEPIRQKKYRYAYAWMRQYEAESSSLTITAFVDYAEVGASVEPDESLVWDEGDWDVAKWDFVDLVTRRVPIKKRGKRVIFEFTDDSIDQPLQVYGIGVEYRVKKPEKA